MERPEFDYETQCDASWTSDNCEDCGTLYFAYYPTCSAYKPLYAHYSGTTYCTSCYPACPNAFHLEVSYNFLKDSGLLNLIYDQTLYLENFYQTCVKPVVIDFIVTANTKAKESKSTGLDKIISDAERLAMEVAIPLMKDAIISLAANMGLGIGELKLGWDAIKIVTHSA